MSATAILSVRKLGLCDYRATRDRMRRFTDQRTGESRDELWLLQHSPVYTLGQAGNRDHLLDPGKIPVVGSDRGGQVTYHGPGQLVAYVLMDLRRAGLGVKTLVHGLEQCVIDLLEGAELTAERRPRAPGVYVDEKKVCALGLRVRNGCSYHGLALNVNMDLRPYRGIDACGYPGLEVTQLSDLGVSWDMEESGRRLVEMFSRQFGLRADWIPDAPGQHPS